MLVASSSTKAKVIVLGGGFAGLESAFLLKNLVKDGAEVTIVSDKKDFFFRPNSIYIPFGLNPDSLMVPIEPACRKKHISFLHSTVNDIDPDNNTLSIGGEDLDYDFAIIATGSGMRPQEIPGLEENADFIWMATEMLKLRTDFEKILDQSRSGQASKVLFLVPPGNKCSGPLYELVMMLDTWLKDKQARENIDISFATFEQGYIQVFGPRLNDEVTNEFSHRGVTGYKQHVTSHVEPGIVHFVNGSSLEFDLLISFPPYVASTQFTKLPRDDRGYLETDLATRQVKGYSNVYAAGDAGDFPVKQAFLAFLQADAAASQVSAQILGRTPRIEYDPVSMCIMEQGDKATFAKIPLELTGDPALPVAVRKGLESDYRVGTGKVWQMGKKLLGAYLKWRFNAGQPFHAGAPWEAMDIGLKVMSSILAK